MIRKRPRITEVEMRRAAKKFRLKFIDDPNVQSVGIGKDSTAQVGYVPCLFLYIQKENEDKIYPASFEFDDRQIPVKVRVIGRVEPA